MWEMNEGKNKYSKPRRFTQTEKVKKSKNFYIVNILKIPACNYSYY